MSYKAFWKHIDIRIYAVLISLILSTLAVLNNDLVNPDGILYLTTASIYAKSGFSAALANYPWPFYPILIEKFSYFTGLSLLSSGHCINAIFIALIVFSFISLIRKLSSSRTAEWLAAFTILTYPLLNGTRDFIVRDFGYWAFLLIAFTQLINLQDTNRNRHIIMWFLASLLAFTFRIEGIIILALSPLAILFLSGPFKSRALKLIKIYSLAILMALAFILWKFLHRPSHADIGRLNEISQEFLQGIQLIHASFISKAQIISHAVLNHYSSNDAGIFMLGGIISMFAWLFIATIYPLQLYLALHGIAKNLIPIERDKKIILWFFIGINFLIPLIFISQNLFLSERYLIPVCLFLLIFTVFSLENFYFKFKNRQGKFYWIFPIIILLATMAGCRGLISFKHDKIYVIDAGNWIKKNTPVNATVFSNSTQVIFYTGRLPVSWPRESSNSSDLLTYLLNDNKNWQQANYILILSKQSTVEADKKLIADKLNSQPIKFFTNSHGDTIFIFQNKAIK